MIVLSRTDSVLTPILGLFHTCMVCIPVQECSSCVCLLHQTQVRGHFRVLQMIIVVPVCQWSILINQDYSLISGWYMHSIAMDTGQSLWTVQTVV